MMNAMRPSFHLSLPVPSVEESAAFFTDVLGATVSHRDPSGYVNLDLFGTQITLTTGVAPEGLHDFHFGVNLDAGEFEAMAERIARSSYGGVVTAPRVMDAGTPLERRKLYLTCPAGYRIELKGYR